MFELTVTLAAACILLFISAHAALKGKGGRKAALCFVAALLAATEILDYAVLHLPDGPARFMRAAIFAESLLPAVFALFSLGYARQGSIRSLPLHWRAFLLSTVVFPICVIFLPAHAFF